MSEFLTVKICFSIYSLEICVSGMQCSICKVCFCFCKSCIGYLTCINAKIRHQCCKFLLYIDFTSMLEIQMLLRDGHNLMLLSLFIFKSFSAKSMLKCDENEVAICSFKLMLLKSNISYWISYSMMLLNS